jgi:hypothetical protein
MEGRSGLILPFFIGIPQEVGVVVAAVACHLLADEIGLFVTFIT